MAKVPQVKVGVSEEDDDAFADAPTEKRSVPAELLAADAADRPPVRITTKLRKIEIDQLVAKEKSEAKGSGMHARFEDDGDSVASRERRGAETLPAPPEADSPGGAED